MPVFNTYPKLGSLTGSEVLVLTDSTGTQTRNATAAQIAGAPATSASTGEFYADKGASISRINDRLFVGAATDNPGDYDRTVTPTDWLTSAMAATSIGGWPVHGATSASISRYGTIGLLGASRTSDAESNATLLGYTPSSIGVAAWGVSDDTTNPTTTTAYAFYGEAWRKSGVNYQPTFGMELETVNLGGTATGQNTPYHPNIGGGVYALQIGAGGGQTSGTSDSDVGITFVSNPNAHKIGMLFGATALTGTDGDDSGYGTAIMMACRHMISWATPETVDDVQGANTGALLLSTVTKEANGQRVEFSDNGLLVENSSGELLFSIGATASPNNTLQIQAGSGTQAAGIYVEEGSSGSPNLGLYPGTDGELQITSPVTAQGNTMPTTPTGWLHININGSDYRIPLCSAAQAGG